MRLSRSLAFGLLVTSAPVLSVAAQTLMTVEEFETWSTGQTLDYAANGEVYMREQRLSGGRALLETRDGCYAGTWYVAGDAIGLDMPDLADASCTKYWRLGEQVLASPSFAPPEAPHHHVTRSAQPLDCPDAELGS